MSSRDNPCGNQWIAQQEAAGQATLDEPSSVQLQRGMRSSHYLAAHFDQVSLLHFDFAQHGTWGGGIWLAIWSAILAAHAKGVVSTFTAMLNHHALISRRT